MLILTKRTLIYICGFLYKNSIPWVAAIDENGDVYNTCKRNVFHEPTFGSGFCAAIYAQQAFSPCVERTFPVRFHFDFPVIYYYFFQVEYPPNYNSPFGLN